MRRALIFIVIALVTTPTSARAASPGPRAESLPPTPGACITKNYTDTAGDAVFDARSFQLQYSCTFAGWRLDATLAPGADFTAFGSMDLVLDTDGDPHDGCDGFDWIIRGTIDHTGDSFDTKTYRTASCSSSVLDPGSDADFLGINNDLEIYFTQSAFGDPLSLRWSATISNQGDTSVDFLPDTGAIATTGYPTRGDGFFEVDHDGGVREYGPLSPHGDARGHALAEPMVGMARVPDGNGYWLLGRDGGVFSYGDAHFYGSTGAIHLNEPVVGMAATPSGHGYWFVAADGGIFSYGDARFYGSTGAIHLARPVVGMAPTPSGHGYWLVASDGGIFSFGDARFYGSTGAIHLNQPIVGMTATPTGHGYWFVASDGGIFSFGDARYHGSTVPLHLTSPVIGMRATREGAGYHVVAANGFVYQFGDAYSEPPYFANPPRLDPPVVGIG